MNKGGCWIVLAVLWVIARYGSIKRIDDLGKTETSRIVNRAEAKA